MRFSGSPGDFAMFFGDFCRPFLLVFIGGSIGFIGVYKVFSYFSGLHGMFFGDFVPFLALLKGLLGMMLYFLEGFLGKSKRCWDSK